jgi:cytochrome P450
MTIVVSLIAPPLWRVHGTDRHRHGRGPGAIGPLAYRGGVVPTSTLKLDEIDLSSQDFWSLPWEEREGAFALLRAERPIAHFEDPVLGDSPIPLPPGNGYYALTRHRDITTASRHPEVFRSGQGAVSLIDLPPEMVEYFSGMISTDNPRHTRLRRIVSNAFNPRRVQAIEDSIDRVARDVVDRVAADGGCDFATEIAAPFPLRIICEMMGVPESDDEVVLRASNTILSGGDPEYIPEGEHPVTAVLNAGATLTAMMEELGAYRLEHPVDDLTSALVNSSEGGDALTHQELASFFVLLVTAGNETTRTAISHGLWALTEHPDQRALWQADLEGRAATAVDEIVRWASPVIWMRRTLSEPATLSGTELEAGDKVILMYSSANRDEDVFEDPYRFDVLREPNPHLGFGAAGPHFCLGAHLARREIRVMFRELFRRVPDVAATSEPDRLRSSFVNGIKHLPCAFTPTG